MKKRNIIVLIGTILLVIIHSCTMEEAAAPKQKAEPEEAFLSLNLTSGTPMAAGISTPENGTAEERQISNIYIVLYEPGESDELTRVKYRFRLEAYNTSGKFSGNDVSVFTEATSYRFVSKARKVDYRDYLMLVLVNAKKEVLEVTKEGDSYAQFQTASQPLISSLYSVNEGDNFPTIFMCNAHGLYPVEKSQLMEKAADAEKSSEKPKISVEKILAKVIVKNKTQGNELGDGSTLVSATWTLTHTNKYTYWMRKAAPVQYKGKEITYLDDKNSPSHIRTLYAEDPNWNYAEREATFNIPDHFGFVTDFSQKFPNELNENSDNSIMEYTLENTMVPEDQNNPELITHVIIRAIITPRNIPSGKSYYSFRHKNGNVVCTHENILEWETGNGSNYPEGDEYVSLKEAIVAEKKNSGKGSPFNFDPVTGGEPAQYVGMTENGIIFHKDQINIYTVPIRHFEDATEKTDYGFYGVVRNNIYEVNIIKISGPGETSNYASAQISINSWYPRDDQNEGL